MAEVQLPIAVAAVNDYELIVAGVSTLLSAYPERLTVRDRLVIGDPVTGGPIQVALYDTYGRIGVAAPALRALLAMPEVEHVAVFSLDLDAALVADARAAGATGFISKALSGDAIADAIVEVARGRFVHTGEAQPSPALDLLDWPGKSHGLSERESEVLVLVGEGLSNGEIAKALYISIETVKSHLAVIFKKIQARNRMQAAAWVARSGVFNRYQPAVPDDAPREPPPS
jgi:DNA-binding NarL/FixJ family response regulator